MSSAGFANFVKNNLLWIDRTFALNIVFLIYLAIAIFLQWSKNEFPSGSDKEAIFFVSAYTLYTLTSAFLMFVWFRVGFWWTDSLLKIILCTYLFCLTYPLSAIIFHLFYFRKRVKGIYT